MAHGCRRARRQRRKRSRPVPGRGARLRSAPGVVEQWPWQSLGRRLLLLVVSDLLVPTFSLLQLFLLPLRRLRILNCEGLCTLEADRTLLENHLPLDSCGQHDAFGGVPLAALLFLLLFRGLQRHTGGSRGHCRFRDLRSGAQHCPARLRCSSPGRNGLGALNLLARSAPTRRVGDRKPQLVRPQSPLLRLPGLRPRGILPLFPPPGADTPRALRRRGLGSVQEPGERVPRLRPSPSAVTSLSRSGRCRRRIRRCARRRHRHLAKRRLLSRRERWAPASVADTCAAPAVGGALLHLAAGA
mmetsp:Transcript_37508/g.107785  ORF Transcript_37508/g.107785 Transcript_37508/m.107785 type:complete len:300 (-) Transcript_37508:504-1403(-)